MYPLETFTTVPTTSLSAPLHLACVSGFLDAVELLLEAGASISLKDKNGRTPLHLACQREHTSCVAQMLVWILRSRRGKRKRLSTSEDSEGSSPGFDYYGVLRSIQETDGCNKETPLHLACKSKTHFPSLMELLIRRGAPIGIQNQHGMSPLHTACSSGHSRTAEYLLHVGSQVAAENGAPLKAENENDYPPYRFLTGSGICFQMETFSVTTVSKPASKGTGTPPFSNRTTMGTQPFTKHLHIAIQMLYHTSWTLALPSMGGIILERHHSTRP